MPRNETCPTHNLPIVNADGCPKCGFHPRRGEDEAGPSGDTRCAFVHNSRRCEMPGTMAEQRETRWYCRWHFDYRNRDHGPDQDRFYAETSSPEQRKAILARWYDNPVDRLVRRLSGSAATEVGRKPGEGRTEYTGRLLDDVKSFARRHRVERRAFVEREPGCDDDLGEDVAE